MEPGGTTSHACLMEELQASMDTELPASMDEPRPLLTAVHNDASEGRSFQTSERGVRAARVLLVASAIAAVFVLLLAVRGRVTAPS